MKNDYININLAFLNDGFDLNVYLLSVDTAEGRFTGNDAVAQILYNLYMN